MKIRPCSRRRPPTASGTYSYALTLSYGGQTSNTCQAELEVETPNSSSSEEDGSSSSSENSSSSATVESSSSVKSLAITCGISTYNYGISGGDEFYRTLDLYLIGKNKTNENEIYTVNVYNGSTSLGDATISSNTNVSNLASLGKLSEGSYTFHVMYNNEVICSHSITVVNPVGCSVSASNIELGESVTISTTYPGDCWGSSFTASPSAKASIGASDNVTLALTGVTGCDEGGDYCNYSVTGDGNISVSGNSYTGGSLPVFTDNTVTSEDSKSYTVRLTNSAGSVEQTCSVEFVEGSSGSEGDTIILNYQGELTTITAGTYTIYSTNQWSGVMRCEADETVTVTVDGVEKTVNTSISSLDGANPRTNVSVVLVVPPGKEIRCHTDW